MSKNIIIVKDLVKGTSTNAEAMPLFFAIKDSLDKDIAVILSLRDCTPMSSSFLNSSIGNIITDFGFDALKGKLTITDYTPSLAKTIKDYIDGCKALSIAS